jgi:hypothetical protein
MPSVADLRRKLDPIRVFYVAAGAGDLAVSTLCSAPGRIASVRPATVRDTVGRLSERTVDAVVDWALNPVRTAGKRIDRANATYAELAQRGEEVVARIRR